MKGRLIGGLIGTTVIRFAVEYPFGIFPRVLDVMKSVSFKELQAASAPRDLRTPSGPDILSMIKISWMKQSEADRRSVRRQCCCADVCHSDFPSH